ncbi:acyltransferase [Amycolatopsis jejuensis]|uniref:acyltransferase n=1 Tax=Amycolatopsis jejuensis TaxID=330084 RepID=UPI000527A217|nr:acyltransferase [Amycolatopsis jejuensis]
MTTTEIPRVRPDEPAAPAKSPHLRQLDLYRVITFALVILIHVLGSTTYPQDVTADAFQAPLHLTREAFFALTTFVLVFQYRDRPLQPGTFWRRRFPLVAVPYVVWSVIYWAYSLITTDQPPVSAGAALRALGIEIVTGNAWYHMYFMLVTLQVYLVFPLLVKLIGLIRRRPWLVLGVSGAVQVAITLFMSYPPASVGYVTISHFFATLLPYQFYSLLGATAAVHFETMHGWLRAHGKWVVGAMAAGLVLTETGYFVSVHHGEWPELASDAFRPYLIPWCIAAIAGIYLAGARWAEGRQRGGRFVSWAVDRSFAVFLTHPIAIALLDPLIEFIGDRYGAPWTTLVVYPATIALTFAIVALLRRLPWSKALTGRAPVRALA